MLASRNLVRRFKRFLHEMGNRGDAGAVDEFCAPHFVEHQRTPPSAPDGRSQVRAYFAMMRTGLPDLTITFDDAFQVDDKVVARTTWSGTHNGELFGIPPTGKPVAFQAIDIVRFEGDKLVEHWGVVDRGTLSMQVGAPEAQNVYVKTATKAKRAARLRRIRPRTSRAASLSKRSARRVGTKP